MDSADPDARAAGVVHIKRWMDIAVELGAHRQCATSRVTANRLQRPIRASGEAFRELADYAAECGLRPATENYRHFNMKAHDLLGVLEHAERDYGVIADLR